MRNHRGKKLVITVGKTRTQMESSGIVTIEAPLTTNVKGGAAPLTVGPGPIPYVPVLVPGKTPSPLLRQKILDLVSS